MNNLLFLLRAESKFLTKLNVALYLLEHLYDKVMDDFGPYIIQLLQTIIDFIS